MVMLTGLKPDLKSYTCTNHIAITVSKISKHFPPKRSNQVRRSAGYLENLENPTVFGHHGWKLIQIRAPPKSSSNYFVTLLMVNSKDVDDREILSPSCLISN